MSAGLLPFEIYPAKTKRAVDKMDVTINETREHKFSAGVDDFCAHAAPPFNFWIGSDGNDLSVVDRNGLGPRLLGVFRVNAAVNDDDIRRFDDPALPAREGSDTQHEQKSLKNDAKRANFHRQLVLKIRMLAAC